MAFFRSTTDADTNLAEQIDKYSEGQPAIPNATIWEQGAANDNTEGSYLALGEALQRRAMLNDHSMRIRAANAVDNTRQSNEDDFTQFNSDLKGIEDPTEQAAFVKQAALTNRANPLFQGLSETWTSGENAVEGVAQRKLTSDTTKLNQEMLDSNRVNMLETANLKSKTNLDAANIEHAKGEIGLSENFSTIIHSIGAMNIPYDSKLSMSSLATKLGKDPAKLPQLDQIGKLTNSIGALQYMSEAFKEELTPHNSVINAIASGSQGRLDPTSSDPIMMKAVNDYVTKHHNLSRAWSIAQPSINNFNGTKQAYNQILSSVTGPNNDLARLNELVGDGSGTDSEEYQDLYAKVSLNADLVAGSVNNLLKRQHEQIDRHKEQLANLRIEHGMNIQDKHLKIAQDTNARAANRSVEDRKSYDMFIKAARTDARKLSPAKRNEALNEAILQATHLYPHRNDTQGLASDPEFSNNTIPEQP